MNRKPLEQVFDLMCNLGATDKQLEYATIYASGRYFNSLLLSSLELSDTKIYEP